MRSLLSTKEQRQLRLMEILIHKRKWIRLHELAHTGYRYPILCQRYYD